MFVLVYNDQERVEVLGVYSTWQKAYLAKSGEMRVEGLPKYHRYLMSVYEVQLDAPPSTAYERLMSRDSSIET